MGKLLFIISSLFLGMSIFVNLEVAYADTDLTLVDMQNQLGGGANIDPDSVVITGLLDDFNRPDGPIGGNWTVQNGNFNIVNNMARGGDWGLATYNGAISNVVSVYVQVVGTDLQYGGVVLGYLDNFNNLFLKVQQQNWGGKFDHAACYVGNNGSGGTFGLGFFSLSAPFSTAIMTAELSGSTVTITFSNIDGGSGVQTYICNGAPSTGGNGIGISGYNNVTLLDNFATGVLPDLIISNLIAKVRTYGTQMIRGVLVNYTVTNQGNGDANPSCLDFYLSRDTVLDGGDVYVGTEIIDPLGAGGSDSGDKGYYLPFSKWQSASGTWRVIGVADACDDNAESDETNNQLAVVAGIVVK